MTPAAAAAPRPWWPVAVGGAVGTAARALVGLALPAAGGWPWATFGANLVGAVVLGALLGAAERDPRWRRWSGPAVTTGALGAFTTFSALATEALGLGALAGGAYALTSVAAGLLAAAVGWRLGRGRP